MINGMERLAYDGGRLTEMILSRLTMRQKRQSTDKDGWGHTHALASQRRVSF